LIDVARLQSFIAKEITRETNWSAALLIKRPRFREPAASPADTSLRDIMFSCVFVVALFCASDALAQSPTSNTTAAPDPAAAAKSNEFIEEPITADNSDEFVEEPVGAGSTTPQPATPVASTSGPFGFLDTAARSSNLLGDMWGFRTLLSKYGMTLSIVEQSEVLGNATGGIRQGFAYEGLTTATLQLDTARAFNWDGGLFNVSGLQIHGRNLSADNLLSLQTASGIESDRSTRLWELWYQHKFMDGNLDVRLGQQSIDQEFMVSQNSGYFINTMAGWPMLPSANMPGGGPAYPLSALGARAKYHVTDSVTVLAGVFNGSPVSDNTGDPQINNRYGTSFPLNGGVLAIAELQFAYPSSGTVVHANDTDTLSGTYKIGIWYDSQSFADQHFDNSGLSLADPASTGIAATHKGNYAIYAVADQMIYRWADDPGRNINIYVRPMIAPQQDRNLVYFSVNAGLTMHEPFAGRGSDTFGLGMGFTRVSNAATAFDQDTALFNPGVYSPVRRSETFIEATYQYQVMPWWQIQPDIQYVFNPGAGIVNPNNPIESVKNEWVFGVRTNITF
jgi:porin